MGHEASAEQGVTVSEALLQAACFARGGERIVAEAICRRVRDICPEHPDGLHSCARRR